MTGSQGLVRPLVVAVVAAALGAPLAAQEWPSFRDPQASGVAAGSAPVAASWNVAAGDGVLWKTPKPGAAPGTVSAAPAKAGR
jgi:hypothetical protein